MDDEKLLNELNWWEDHYELIADYNVLERVILGEKNSKCRFCGKSEPEVAFKDLAHAIPEALENNKLFSFYECDSCNHEFGETIEDHLSKYLFPLRVGSAILGKKGTLTYKVDEVNRLDVTEGHWKVQQTAENPIAEIVDEHTLRLNLIRQTYIPILAYKALVKIAITVLPESEIANIGSTINWLKDNSKQVEDCFGQFVMMRFFPGLKPFPFIKVFVFRRKSDSAELPMYQVSLNFNNYNFHYIIPCMSKDLDLDGKTINLKSFPTIHDAGTFPMPIGSGILNLSSHEKVRGEKAPVSMHYETKEVDIGKT